MASRRRKGPVERAFARSLRGITSTDADRAVVELGRMLAQAIDEGGTLSHLGPQLREVLVELGLTPKARAALTKGAPQPVGPNPLDELRARREAEARGPQA